MTLLTKEQIEALTYKEAKAHLKMLEKTYKLTMPLQECMKEVWPNLDDITDNLLWVEDRIYDYEDPRRSTLVIEDDDTPSEDFITNYG